jgi:arsenate reductase
MKSVLFVCVENSNRSQMAEAFAKMFGKNILEAFSAGSKPSGKINPKAIAAMKEKGYDLRRHSSKSLSEIPDIRFDYVITMGCGDECPMINAVRREDWNIPDPREMNPAEFNVIRDLIKKNVLNLISEINETAP